MTDTDQTNLDRRYRGYAAKVSAETVRAEPPVVPDLSDAGLAAIFAGCVRPARTAEYPAIRAAFAAMTSTDPKTYTVHPAYADGTYDGPVGPAYSAPCGADFDTADDARNHEALCDQCAGATEAHESADEMTVTHLKVSGVGQGLLGYDVLTDAEARADAVAQWGEAAVAANEADVARRFNRPRKGEPFHPITNTGATS